MAAKSCRDSSVKRKKNPQPQINDMVCGEERERGRCLMTREEEEEEEKAPGCLAFAAPLHRQCCWGATRVPSWTYYLCWRNYAPTRAPTDKVSWAISHQLPVFVKEILHSESKSTLSDFRGAAVACERKRRKADKAPLGLQLRPPRALIAFSPQIGGREANRLAVPHLLR